MFTINLSLEAVTIDVVYPAKLNENRNTVNEQLHSLLIDGLQALDLNIDSAKQAQLLDLVHLLNKWNRVYNLTAVRDPNQMVSKHILDSLSLLPWLPASMNKQSDVFDLLDVGSGAGLPVLPLAITRPELRCLSVESNGKKTRFQQQACVELKLNNVTVQQARIEDITIKAATIVSRAFTAPDNFLRIIEPHCIAGTQIIIMLGLKERMPQTLPNGFTLQGLHKIDVPDVDSSRHVAICVKD